MPADPTESLGEAHAIDAIALTRALPPGAGFLKAGGTFPGHQYALLDCGNGFGLSVLRRYSGPENHSYGGEQGLWEVLPGYVTGTGFITALYGHWLRAHFGWHDARGWLTPGEVLQAAREIAALPQRDYPVPAGDEKPAPGSPRVPGCYCEHCDHDGG